MRLHCDQMFGFVDMTASDFLAAFLLAAQLQRCRRRRALHVCLLPPSSRPTFLLTLHALQTPLQHLEAERRQSIYSSCCQGGY